LRELKFILYERKNYMSWYRNYKLVKENDEYIVEIYLNPSTPEFSEELLSTIKENILTFDKEIEKLVQEKFPDVKINTVKLILGALVVGSIPFMPNIKAHAAEVTPGIVQTSTAATVLSTSGLVTASKLNMRTGPSTYNSIMHILWQGNRVKVIGQSSGWYQIRLSDGRTGWVSSAYLKLDTQANSRQEKIDTVIASAKSLVGTPYVWGGRSLADGGFDCSGFTQYVYGKVGITLNRVSYDQEKQGLAVSRANLQPGDLVFASLAGDGNISHVGIYIGDGKMIHSPKTGDVVKITDITTEYWESRFVTARRVI
jgi:cell wall-associated NlpC family hydrolase